MKPLRGCLAVASLPAVLAGGSVAMVHRWFRVRRRGSGLRATVRRTGGNPERLDFELAAPAARVGELARALATAVSEAAAAASLHVGIVTAVPGEDPVLVTVAPQRDLVADRFERSLLVGQAHLHPHLWLVLEPGTYLAEAVPPFEPFAATPARAAEVLSTGRCRQALLVRVRPGSVEWAFTLTVLARPGGAHGALRGARRVLGGLEGWGPADVSGARGPGP